MIVVHVALVAVFMTLDATEQNETAVCRVAFDALIPFITMAARVDREMLLIVIECRVPVVRRMTVHALLRVAGVVIR